MLLTALAVQFLGLKGRESYLEPQILAAYEELASTVVEEGYSSRVQDGKLRVLEQAADEVRLQSSTGIDSEIQVQWDDLPGALALLQEVRIGFCTNLPVVMQHACPRSPIACLTLAGLSALLWSKKDSLYLELQAGSILLQKQLYIKHCQLPYMLWQQHCTAISGNRCWLCRLGNMIWLWLWEQSCCRSGSHAFSGETFFCQWLLHSAVWPPTHLPSSR